MRTVRRSLASRNADPGAVDRPSIGRVRGPRRPRRRRRPCRRDRGTPGVARPCTGRWPSHVPGGPPSASRRAEPVDERGEHRRVQPAARCGRALEPPGDRHEVEAVRCAPAPRARVGSSGSGRVSASSVTTQSVVAARNPCCSAHALPAQPSGSGSPAHDAGTESGGDVRRAVARLVVDHDHLLHARRPDDALEQRTDPARLVARRDHHRDRHVRSRRPPVTSVPGTNVTGCGAGRTGGATRAARASRATATAAAAIRAPSNSESDTTVAGRS